MAPWGQRDDKQSRKPGCDEQSSSSACRSCNHLLPELQGIGNPLHTLQNSFFSSIMQAEALTPFLSQRPAVRSPSSDTHLQPGSRIHIVRSLISINKLFPSIPSSTSHLIELYFTNVTDCIKYYYLNNTFFHPLECLKILFQRRWQVGRWQFLLLFSSEFYQLERKVTSDKYRQSPVSNALSFITRRFSQSHTSTAGNMQVSLSSSFYHSLALAQTFPHPYNCQFSL